MHTTREEVTMKIRVHREPFMDSHIGIVVGGSEHMISTDEANQIIADLSAALRVVEPPSTNDAYFENYFNLLIKKDLTWGVDPGVMKRLKGMVITAMKNVERDTRHSACEMLQAAIHNIHNMEHRP